MRSTHTYRNNNKSWSKHRRWKVVYYNKIYIEISINVNVGINCVVVLKNDLKKIRDGIFMPTRLLLRFPPLAKTKDSIIIR